MGLRSFIFKRIIYSFILVILVITLNYVIFLLMPGDPVGLYASTLRGLGVEQKEELIRRLKEQLGIGDPPPVQYGKYLRNLLVWNFGLSTTSRQPVANEMGYRLQFTLIMMGLSTVFAILFGIFLGILVAYKHGGKFDSFAVFTSLMFYSLPTFWMGMLAIEIFSVYLGWFPHAHAFPDEWSQSATSWPVALITNSQLTSQGTQLQLIFNPDKLVTLITGFVRHAFLPVTVLTLFQYGGFLLLTRATMLEALTEDYITTARAKGVEERNILLRHALKNASLPLITSVALSFGFMISGAMITETVFSWPGMGYWIYQAIQNQDINVFQAVFYVIAVCVIAANFVADLLYGVIDPRIKYG
ncbi:MAG: ABC transporter permease [Candidatus Bathyarchaeales archaeon]